MLGNLKPYLYLPMNFKVRGSKGYPGPKWRRGLGFRGTSFKGRTLNPRTDYRSKEPHSHKLTDMSKSSRKQEVKVFEQPNLKLNQT